MKSIKFTFAALAAAVLLTGCAGNGNSSATSADTSATSAAESQSSGTTATLASKTEALLGAVTFPSMVEVTSDKLTTFFGIEPADVTEFSAYICGSSAMPDEFGVFVAADADKASAIETLLNERIEKQRETYTDYTPDEMYKFDDCFVSVNGNTVIYAICADNTTAGDMLK